MRTKLFFSLIGMMLLGLTVNAQNVPLKSAKATEYGKNSYGEFWYPHIGNGDAATIGKYFTDNKISDEQVESLKIRSLRHNFLKSAAADRIIVGETLSDTDKGKVVLIHAYQDKPDGNDWRYIYDYMVTYDKAGNYIDSKLIGQSGLYGTSGDPEIKFWVDGNTSTIYVEERMGGESETLPYNVNSAMKIVRKR